MKCGRTRKERTKENGGGQEKVRNGKVRSGVGQQVFFKIYKRMVGELEGGEDKKKRGHPI